MKVEVDSSKILPSQFMRARRPTLFSDSQVKSVPVLSREVFEYHLETLTSRKEETKFEHFARKLVEKEICPNLVPQTGPTGGGDSKTDTETYPVSSQIAETWYSGIDQGAAKERWAFAFSAKKAWLPKARADISGIAATGRGHSRIFFVTNQFVPDRKRADAEDRLSSQSGVSVRILDRTWIVEKVFGNNRIALAAEALGLTDLSQQLQAAQGPIDYERTQALRELDAQIADEDRYRGVPYQLGEDCHYSAVLARNLERPRTEVEGRFERAARVAERVGHIQQRLRIAYGRAWTSYWWYDDFEDLNTRYAQVEDLAKDSEQAEDVELLFNVWQVLHTSVLQGQLDRGHANLDSRTSVLKLALDRLAGNATRPNNAMRARTDRLLIDLSESMGNPAGIESALLGLKEVAESSEQLIHYPIAQLYGILSQLGEFLADNTTFDAVFETVASIIERRTGEGEAGKAYLKRGFQKLHADLPYEAIRYFGRAQHKLSKHEYRSSLVTALTGAGNAYESIGLLWAAKSSVTSAAYLALSEFREAGTIVKAALFTVRKLAWIELQLGRVPCVLAWTEMADVLMHHIEASEGPNEEFAGERLSQDMLLASLLLRSELPDLAQVGFLVDVLERLNLPHAQMALMYALGHEEQMRADGWIPAEETSETVREFFWKLTNNEATAQIARRAEYHIGPRFALHSNVLGCEIDGSVASGLPSMFLGEGVIGGLEAFLATSLNADAFPYRQNFKVLVDPTVDRLEFPIHEILELSDPGIQIRHSIPIYQESGDAQQRFFDVMLHIVIIIANQIAKFQDFETFLDQVAGEERAFERSINNAHIESLMTMLMGPKPKVRLEDWKGGDSKDIFPLRRDAAWSDGLELVKDPSGATKAFSPKIGQGEPPEGLFELEKGRHSDRKILSLIDIPLWDKAKWKGVAFGWTADEEDPPVLGLVFENSEAASTIFKGWRKRLGKIDQEDDLRLAILTGITSSNPTAYRFIVSSRIKVDPEHKGLFVLASRSHTMDQSDPRNLDGFLARFRRLGRFRLVPAHLDGPGRPNFMFEHWIGKGSIEIRPAWQVSENDPDAISLRPDDDPIIPSDVQDAPVIRALERIRMRRGPE